MKAQRRHELKTNALASKIIKLPDIGRQIAGRIITGAVLAIIVALLVWYYLRDRAQEQARLLSEFSTARTQASVFPNWEMQFLSGQRPWTQYPAFQKALVELADELRPTLNGVETKASDPTLKAEAYLTEADIDWHLANLPAVPATTQPSTPAPLVDRTRLLEEAEQIYGQVAQNFRDQASVFAAAQMGLAAIAEDRHNWSAAREAYQAIISDKGASAAFTTLASARMNNLTALEHPMPLVAPQPKATTNPATTEMSVPISTSAPTTTAASASMPATNTTSGQ